MVGRSFECLLQPGEPGDGVGYAAADGDVPQHRRDGVHRRALEQLVVADGGPNVVELGDHGDHQVVPLTTATAPARRSAQSIGRIERSAVTSL